MFAYFQAESSGSLVQLRDYITEQIRKVEEDAERIKEVNDRIDQRVREGMMEGRRNT